MNQDITTEYGPLHVRRNGKWTDLLFDLIDHPATPEQTKMADRIAGAMADRCFYTGRRKPIIGAQGPKCWTVTVPSHHRDRTADVLIALRRGDFGPAVALLASCQPYVQEMRARRAG